MFKINIRPKSFFEGVNPSLENSRNLYNKIRYEELSSSIMDPIVVKRINEIVDGVFQDISLNEYFEHKEEQWEGKNFNEDFVDELDVVKPSLVKSVQSRINYIPKILKLVDEMDREGLLWFRKEFIIATEKANRYESIITQNQNNNNINNNNNNDPYLFINQSSPVIEKSPKIKSNFPLKQIALSRLNKNFTNFIKKAEPDKYSALLKFQRNGLVSDLREQVDIYMGDADFKKPFKWAIMGISPKSTENHLANCGFNDISTKEKYSSKLCHRCVKNSHEIVHSILDDPFICVDKIKPIKPGQFLTKYKGSYSVLHCLLEKKFPCHKLYCFTYDHHREIYDRNDVSSERGESSSSRGNSRSSSRRSKSSSRSSSSSRDSSSEDSEGEEINYHFQD
ncbi:hypothetical protein DICPUDRAFT_83875 [Dictyostelium purpureum]|uniref:Uncharacterized protein n=1 Tax=Dictyostelium purpureum TaxID=5786 RepID=F1A0W6_DICPU|nr:uncharacterized protein DICPUDRAFT_83875 [Dictyostelium purpureum]EGC30163.1 hypothetical protein DICPUDRAFT_83875 [Dictyostelium purpureum]|eukprot:XP_003293308.1 hypothetical protein DICPUDRAFT_83875 [Dictyostelium purpureum]